MSHNKGFTLIEMVVVLAVVAILAAILTPTISKNINDAKIARATNEAQVIAASIGSFFKDTGRWPTSDGSDLTDNVELLYGPGDEPAADAGGTNVNNWLRDTTSWETDEFGNHLIQNNPGADATDYPTAATLELRWRGPYLTEIKADPWGSHYACNIIYTYNTTTNAVCVWSAGPDRTASVDAIQAATTFALNGDDIVYRIQ